MDFDEICRSQDSVEAGIHIEVEDTSITVDSDTEWDAIPTVDSNLVSESHRQFFNADSFYRFEVTIAKPIPQTYTVDDDEYTFLKPRDELQKASWSLENAPYVLEHPERGAVTDASDIRGFFHSSYYDVSDDSLNAKLTVPKNDSGALEYLQQSSDVSIGFYNTLDADADDVDAYQRNLYIDHVASVETGRCSSEDGCEIHMNTTQRVDSDMSDATCDCNGGNDTTMTDDMNMGIDSLTVDAVRERNDNVDERIEKLKEQVREKENDSEALESIRDELEVDAEESVTTAVEMLQDRAEKLDDELSAYKEAEVAELRESICDASEYEMDDLEDMDKEALSYVSDALDHSGIETDDDSDSDVTTPEDKSSLKTATNDSESNSDSRSTGFDDVNYDRQID